MTTLPIDGTACGKTKICSLLTRNVNYHKTNLTLKLYIFNWFFNFIF